MKLAQAMEAAKQAKTILQEIQIPANLKQNNSTSTTQRLATTMKTPTSMANPTSTGPTATSTPNPTVPTTITITPNPTATKTITALIPTPSATRTTASGMPDAASATKTTSSGTPDATSATRTTASGTPDATARTTTAPEIINLTPAATSVPGNSNQTPAHATSTASNLALSSILSETNDVLHQDSGVSLFDTSLTTSLDCSECFEKEEIIERLRDHIEQLTSQLEEGMYLNPSGTSQL